MAFYSMPEAKRVLVAWIKDWSSAALGTDADFQDWAIVKEYTAYVFTPPGQGSPAYLVDGDDVLELGSQWDSIWDALSVLRVRRREVILASLVKQCPTLPLST